MDTIYNVYQVNKSSHHYKDYFILFGNSDIGWNVTKEELKEYWIKAVKASKSTRVGDVTLMYKGRLIRAVNNFEVRLLDKTNKYKCSYNKYKYEKT